ncbi:Sacsin-like [Oopsacas minuta]|uniref:Poly [ADP-ribose] polymerase n=1 Tax=Oopsacas minuta TaxID=111878 RepID=A0AAV7JDU2_9METZ|nr:Sacsin-like [Oopsacas minuta]
MAENISRRKRDAPITTDNPKRQQISHDESSDSSSEDERDFGQRTPPLIEYIKGILNSYPDGSQILKEIIQNADDAEATSVAFLLDYTKHSCVNLIKPVCSLYQGEALYSWNNAKFKTRDWEGIRNIGISGKVEETLKVGRFGLGFVAVYHITDVPMILSNNSIGILDPQQQIYPNEPGKRIKLKKFFKDPVYSAHQNCFRSYFDYNGLSKYDGTIFRFPLRNKQSKSKIKPAGLYTADSVMAKLFKPLQEESSNILIFLKNIKSITLYTKSGIETKKIFSINIPNNYIDDVVYSNRLLSNHVEQKNFHKSIKVTINLFPISSLNSREDKVWLVLNMIGFPQSQTELYEFYSKSNLNYLPWIGIAMETGITSDQLGTSKAMNFQDDWDGNNLLDFIYRILENFNFHLTVRFNHKLSADTGKLFCFLPTPEPTDLPFNLHGYFALSNDRRQIKWPSVDSQDTDSTWNKLLIEQLGVSAYAIFYSILLNSFHHGNPGNYHYQMLGASTLKKQSSILIDQGLRILANEKIVYSCITNEWIKIEEGIYLSDVNTNINCPLEKLLKLLKEPLVLLPKTILTLFNRIDSVKNDIDRRRVTPALLRQLLVKHSNNPALNVFFIANLKDHTFVILNFILSDFTVHNSNFSNQLDSIPLLKVATPHIFKFSINPKTYYYVYDDTFDFVNLFPGTEGSFVDRGIPTEIYSRILMLSHTCKGKINLKDISNIKTDLDLLKRLFELSIKSHFMITTPPLKWNPNFFPFNKSWIKLVWSFIGSDENLARSLGDLPLLPTHDLYSINNQLLPIVSSNTSSNYIQCSTGDKCKPLENILLECGSVFIHSHKFVECLDSLVLSPIPNGLLTLLQTNNNILNTFINKLRKDTNEQLFELIIDILNNDSRFTNNQIQLIKKLPIFPTINGNHISIAVSTFVRVPGNIYLPSQFQYPANFLSPDIYNVNTLYGKLGITAPDFNNFLINNILPFMQVMIETNMFVQHFNLSIWLLNNLDKVSYQNIQVLKTTKWIVDNSNSISQPCNYRQPNQLFYPDDDMLKILLPSKSNFFVHKDYKDYFHMAKKLELFFISTQLTNQKMFEAVTQSAVCYFHLDINVPNCNELWRKRFSTLLQFVTSCWKSSNLNTDPISRILLSSSIVLPSYTRPGDYPKCIPFLGERKLTQLQSVVFCNDIDISLIASVRICVQFFPSYQDNQSNELLNHLNCNTEVTGGMMAEQLNKISLTSIHSSDPKRIHSLLNRIYSSPSILTVIDEIVTHFVYVKHTNSFIEAKLVARNLDYSLEPFYYSFEKLNYSEAAWKLFENCGANESLSDNQLYQILDTLYQSQSMDSRPHNVKLILNIIHSLYNSQTQSFSDHFLLGVDNLLHLATECVVYDNPLQSSKESQVNKNDKMYFIVNSNISRLVALKFGATSFKLTMLGDQLGFFKFKGQFEELTTRLRSILKEYESNIDVYKELLQNADDAKANTARILIDYNSFPTDSLIEPTMKQWQGPALYFYDDAQFTDADFDNIMEIFGETKLEDKLKIGKFGLGFNTVYHLTDLPSFVSGRYIHMLDPNRKFLHRSNPPGIQVDFVLNNTETFEFRDQFSVFNLKLFGCDVFDPEPFNGTLFRLPFRTVSSDISGTVYNSSAIGELKSRILLEAESSIRFLQHIKCIEIYEKPLTSKPVLLLKVSKKEITQPFELHETFISKNLAHFDELLTTPNVTPVVHHQKVTITCERLSGKESKSFIISYSTGIQQCIEFLEENSHRKISNYMPVTSVALPLNSIGKSPPKKNNYYMYCYLPLPVTSPYPMYINGCFALDQSRRGIACTEDGSDRTTWNIALVNDSLVNTFINLFVQIRGEFSKGKEQIYEFYRLWPLNAQPHLIIWREFPKAFAIRVMNTDTPLFYYGLGNEWIGYNEANFIFYEDYSDFNSLKEFYNFARRKCLQFNISLVDLGISLQSTHLFHIILQNNKDKIFSLERICREVIFPNFSTFSFPDIKLVLTSLLPVIHKGSQNWVKELFSNVPCIPCGAGEDYSLLEPSEVISPRSPVARLYCPSDKRTIHPDLDKLFAPKTIHYKALKILKIIENTLPVSDLIERCECQISFLNPRRFEHCMTILQYLNNMSSSSPSGYEDRDLKLIQSKLVNIKLIPVWNDLFLIRLGLQRCTQFASPSQCYSYDLRYLMSTNCYAVTKEVDKLKCIETFLSIREAWKSINIRTLASLLQSLREKEGQIHSFNLQNELSARAENIYTTIFKHWVNDPAVSIETLNYIWHPVSGSFRHTSYIVSSEKFSHYSCKFLLTFPYKLNYENKGLRESFLQRLEIKENISQTDAHRILHLIARENSNIHDELLIDLIIVLTNLFFHNVQKYLFSNNPKQVLLSTELQLCPGCELVINDMPWEETGYPPSLNRSNTVHKRIHPIAAFNLGARSKRSEYYTSSAFEEFGQYEDIADRIRGLKRAFPCGTTILKELLQNAEDAGATEVAFILDTTEYSSRTNTLCLSENEQPNWHKYQQYTSLLVYNNSTFSDKDLQGIQSVGLGGKKDSHTIGKFGLGFNAVYNLTDSPCLLTRRNNGGEIYFCIFDPFRKFLILPPQNLPGMKFTFKSENIDQFPDQFIPYSLESLNTTSANTFPTLTNGDYTIFRIPIMESSIETEVEKILSDFLKNSSNFNLFLNNIQRISIYKRDKDSTTMMGTFKLLVTPLNPYPPPISLNCKFLNTIQITKREIIHEKFTTISPNQPNVSILGKRNRSYPHTSSWILFTHEGSMKDLEKCSPQITKYKSIYEREKLTHQVYGGIAVHVPTDASCRTPTGGSCLYSYLPIGDDRSVNFPILINAPFILEPERQHIRFRDVSGDSPEKLEWEDVWHSSIIQHVIAPLFASLLIYLKSRADTELTNFIDSDYYDWYYSLYPDMGKLIEGNQVYTNFLYALCKELYILMYSSNEKILISSGCYERLHPLHGEHGGIFPDSSRRLSGISSSHNLLSASKSRKHSLEQDSLYLTLKKLRLPLTGAPDHIYHSFKKFSCYLTRLDQTILLSFLNRIEYTAFNALILSMKEIDILLEYLFSAKPECILLFQKIPLKIDFNGGLGHFTKTKPTFTPAYGSLLPHRAGMFVSSIFPINSIQILCAHGFMQELSPDYLSNNLEVKEFQLQECCLFWKFILQSGLQSYDLIQKFGKFPLVPIKNNPAGEYTLISNLPAILNTSSNASSNKELYSSLIKLNCYVLCLDKLAKDDFDVSTLAMYLQPLVISSTITFPLFISAVKLSDINIECVRFDKSEATSLRNLLPNTKLNELTSEEIRIISLLKIFLSHQDVLCCIAQFDNFYIHNSTYNIGALLINKLTNERVTIFKASKKQEALIKHIAKTLRIHMVTESDFFLVYVLRYFTQLDINGQRELLLFIQNTPTSYEMDFIHKLKSVRFIHRNRLVSDCYSPEVGLFKIFFSEDLLPNEWSNTYGYRNCSQILCNLGLHDKADLESILTAAQKIESRKFIYTSSDYLVPLSALAQLISKGINLNIHNTSLLQQLSKIEFLPVWKCIPNSSANTQIISSFSKAELCEFKYSCCMATHIHNPLVSDCYTYTKKYNTELYLNIRSKPDIQTVISHLELICDNFNEIHVHHHSIMDNLFIETYGFLQENCSQNLKNKFTNIKCIYYENKLFYPRNMVFSLNTIILEYLFKVPDALKSYHAFLKLVGVSESADYFHYAAVMNDIYHDRPLRNEQRKEISKTTFQLFISTLRKAEQSNCTINIDPLNTMVLSDIYEIVPIPNVVYIDNTRLKIHIESFPSLSNLQFLLELPPNSLGSCKPPVSLKIKHLSEIISATLDPALKNAGTISRYRNECLEMEYLLKCREFAKGLIRIYYHSNIADGKGDLSLIRIKNGNVKDISKEPGIANDPLYLTCFQILQKLSITIVSTLSMQITEVAGGAVITKDGIYDCFIENSVLYANGGNIKNVNFFHDLTYALNLHFGNIFSDMLFALQLCLSCDNTCDIMKKLDSFNIQACPFIDDINLPSVKSSTSLVMRTTPISSSRLTPSSTSTSHYPTATRPAGVTRATLLQIIHTPPIRLISNTISAVISNEDKFIAKLWIRTAQCDLRAAKKLVCEEADGAIFPPHACANCFECAMKTCIAILYINKYNKANISCQRNLDILLDIVKIFFKSTIAYNNFSSLCVSLINFDENAKNPLMTPGIGCCIPMEHISVTTAREAIKNTSDILGIVKSEFPTFKELMFSEDDKIWIQPTAQSLMMTQIENFDLYPTLTKEELLPDSDEYSAVARNFMNTLPNATIMTVLKIHHKTCWDNFVKNIKRKIEPQDGDDGSSNFRENTLLIKPLFHGSSSTDPEVIIQDPVGFNVKYAKEGMWGRGIYFAQNASYSHGLAYKDSTGICSMFLSKVFVGNARYEEANSELLGPRQGYHSVTGIHPAGTKVYILYENGLAYPGYLINYRPGTSLPS